MCWAPHIAAQPPPLPAHLHHEQAGQHAGIRILQVLRLQAAQYDGVRGGHAGALVRLALQGTGQKPQAGRDSKARD